MLGIAVCDDNEKFAGKLETMLYAISKKEHFNIDVDVFFNGEELINSVCNERKQYDLIFLDIEMKGMDGLEAAHRIREKDNVVLLIYITSHKSYVVDAYEVQSFRFMTKPIEPGVLRDYFIKAYEKIISGEFYYHYKYGKEYCKLLVNDIVYFESKKRVIYIHMLDGSIHKYYHKLNDIEKWFEGKKVEFWRIHQSYFINSRYLFRMSYNKIELNNKKVLFISEDRRKLIGELYCDYIGDEIIE